MIEPTQVTDYAGPEEGSNPDRLLVEATEAEV